MLYRSCRTRIFIFYSDKDRRSFEHLHIHLESLGLSEIVDGWNDTQKFIDITEKSDIEYILDKAKISILLISDDFLASQFVVSELPHLLSISEDEGLVVLPVILKPSRFNRTPGLSEFQSINLDPLLEKSEVEQEKTWSKLACDVEKIIRQSTIIKISSRDISSIRILLIEDDSSWQNILQTDIRDALPDIQLDLRAAKSFDEGWSALNNEMPWHLMITDVALPSVNDKILGKILIAKARKLQIPTIVVSGQSTQDEVNEFLEEMGVYDFFGKGVYHRNLDKFVNKVNGVLYSITNSNPKQFDVFLSYKSSDKNSVIYLAEELRKRNISVWIDEWELIPGRLWQEALEEIIEITSAAIVFVGSEGIGPWQDREMRASLSEFVNRGLPVIPVLLPGAPSKPALPIFLKLFTWVDLRDGLTVSGLDRIQWGITGVKPNSTRENH